jgi:hypothetical protein
MSTYRLPSVIILAATSLFLLFILRTSFTNAHGAIGQSATAGAGTQTRLSPIQPQSGADSTDLPIIHGWVPRSESLRQEATDTAAADWFSSMTADLVGGIVGTFVGFGLGIAWDRRRERLGDVRRELSLVRLLREEELENRRKLSVILESEDALSDVQFSNSAWMAARAFPWEPRLYVQLDRLYQQLARIDRVRDRVLDPTLLTLDESTRTRIVAAMEKFIMDEVVSLVDELDGAIVELERREKALTS